MGEQRFSYKAGSSPWAALCPAFLCPFPKGPSQPLPSHTTWWTLAPWLKFGYFTCVTGKTTVILKKHQYTSKHVAESSFPVLSPVQMPHSKLLDTFGVLAHLHLDQLASDALSCKRGLEGSDNLPISFYRVQTLSQQKCWAPEAKPVSTAICLRQKKKFQGLA